MKRKITTAAVVTMILCSNVFGAGVLVNNEKIDTEAVIVGGRTLVPVRGVFERLGFNVEWNSGTKTATLSNDDTMIEITNGEVEFKVNGEVIVPDVPQQIIEGKFYLPLRAISEAVEADVEWDNVEKNVIINFDGDSFRKNRQKSQGNGYGTRAMTGRESTERWSTTKESYIYEQGDKLIVLDAGSDIEVDIYDKNSKKLESNKTIAHELPIFGGFYSGNNCNYIAFGQNNSEEDNKKEVIRIVKYDKDFNKIGTLSVNGGECYTIRPFDCGSLDMCENGNELTVHTSRTRYTTEDGLNHESQLTLTIDTKQMTLKNNIEVFQGNHVSHSFNQFVRYDGNTQVLVDLGDAYPRAIVLNKKSGTGYSKTELFKIPGNVGANCTGITVGGFEISKNNYIVAANSIDHSKVKNYDSYNMEGLGKDERDVCLFISKKSNTSSSNVKKVKLTDYVNKGYLASTPYLVKISDNKFAVMWEEFKYSSDNGGITDKGLKYVFIDENGKKISETESNTIVKLSSDCQPAVIDGNIIWYINTSSGRTFYSINYEL